MPEHEDDKFEQALEQVATPESPEARSEAVAQEERAREQQLDVLKQESEQEQAIDVEKAHRVEIVVEKRYDDLPDREELLVIIEEADKDLRASLGTMYEVTSQRGGEVERDSVYISPEREDESEVEVVTSTEEASHEDVMEAMYDRDAREDNAHAEAQRVVASDVAEAAESGIAEGSLEEEMPFDSVLEKLETALVDAGMTNEEIEEEMEQLHELSQDDPEAARHKALERLEEAGQLEVRATRKNIEDTANTALDQMFGDGAGGEDEATVVSRKISSAAEVGGIDYTDTQETVESQEEQRRREFEDLLNQRRVLLEATGHSDKDIEKDIEDSRRAFAEDPEREMRIIRDGIDLTESHERISAEQKEFQETFDAKLANVRSRWETAGVLEPEDIDEFVDEWKDKFYRDPKETSQQLEMMIRQMNELDQESNKQVVETELVPYRVTESRRSEDSFEQADAYVSELQGDQVFREFMASRFSDGMRDIDQMDAAAQLEAYTHFEKIYDMFAQTYPERARVYANKWQEMLDQYPQLGESGSAQEVVDVMRNIARELSQDETADVDLEQMRDVLAYRAMYESLKGAATADMNAEIGGESTNAEEAGGGREAGVEEEPPYDFDALDLQTEVADERFEAEEAREEGLDDAELALQELLERKRMRNLNPKQRERFVERMRSLDADEFASQVELEGYKENIRQMDSLAGPKRAEALALMAAEMMRQSGKKENEIQALLDRWADEYEQEPRKAIERMEASIHYDKMRKVNDQVGKAAKWALWRGSALAIGAGAAGLFGLRTGWQAFGIARRAAKLGAKSMWNTLTEGFQEFVGQKDKKIGVTEGNKDLDRQWANVEEDVADLAADTQSRVTGDNEAIKKRKEARDARWAEKQKKKEKEKKKEAKKKAA